MNGNRPPSRRCPRNPGIHAGRGKTGRPATRDWIDSGSWSPRPMVDAKPRANEWISSGQFETHEHNPSHSGEYQRPGRRHALPAEMNRQPIAKPTTAGKPGIHVGRGQSKVFPILEHSHSAAVPSTPRRATRIGIPLSNARAHVPNPSRSTGPPSPATVVWTALTAPVHPRRNRPARNPSRAGPPPADVSLTSRSRRSCWWPPIPPPHRAGPSRPGRSAESTGSRRSDRAAFG